MPNQELIDFKEAIIFAFLGVKMVYGELNCSSGVGGNLVKGSIAADNKRSIEADNKNLSNLAF